MDLVAQQVSWISIIFMILSIIICFLYPVAIYLYASKKFHTGILSVVIGAGIFIVFGVVLKSIGTGALLLIPGFQNTVEKIPLLYAFVAALLAGIFEESGRFVAFYFLNKKNKCKDVGTAISYGVGHGGIEAIIIVGLVMLNSLLLAMSINFAGADSLVAGLEGDTLKSVVEGINQLIQSNSLLFLVSGFERFIVVSFHVSASILVFISVTDRKKFYFYPVAIALHTILNIPAGFYQLGILSNIFVVEGLIFVIAVSVCGLAYVLVKGMKKKETV